ncbi:MAG: molybdopterin molybdotransferase MoeA [Bacteroidetes bacterium]|nr:molybdopterin molybdotransferase MoeA [Bacteroidota bacterium]
MIPVSEAKKRIVEHCHSFKVELLPLLEANSFVIAEPVFSPIDTPPFNQSAMDGYAFSFANWDGKSPFQVSREIQAGSYSIDALKPLEAVRIFTGAALPPGSDTVVIQEKIIKYGGNITIDDAQITLGSNVRKQGSQTQKGAMALPQGQLLTPSGISFLAGIGIHTVNVFGKPTVSIIVTGKELIKAGNPITDGNIYESNSIGLTAALNQIGLAPISITIVDDDETEIQIAITEQLNSDMIIITGGVSVGDYDLVPAALETCGVEKVFHKVKQKPGKPFYFGTHNQTLIFALPGNPAAVMTCFYEYVILAIGQFTKKEYFKSYSLPLTNDFTKRAGLTHYLKGKMSEHGVTVLEAQESYLLNSFAQADCLIEFEEEREFFKKGEFVKLRMII